MQEIQVLKIRDESHSEDAPGEAIILISSPTGSSSSLNGSSVTGGYTGLFVGGVPQGHSVLQKRLGKFHRKWK